MVGRTLSHIWNLVRKPRIFLGGTILEYVLVGLIFILLTAFYTDWIVFNITKELFIERVGDGTAGFLWLNFVDTDLNPLLGFTDSVNYPVGTTLGGSSFIAYSALWLPLWSLAHIVGPVAALNLVTLWGFLSCALATYWLVKRLFNSIPIALFSGFAATFMPYHIIKSTSHLAYIFSVVFVLIIAAFIGLWRRPTAFRAFLFASALALAFYTDGYFILITPVLLVGLVLGGCLYGMLQKFSLREYIGKAKHLALSAGFFLLLCCPLIYTQIQASSQVAGELSSARKPIAAEIPYYAAERIDFLVPPLQNPFFEGQRWYQSAQVDKHDHSNFSESTLYIGYTLIILSVVGVIAMAVLFFRKALRRSMGVDQVNRVAFLSAIFIVPLPLLLGFMIAPYKELFGMAITMPSGLLIDYNITLWRVMTRFFLPFHLLIVLFAALSLWLIYKMLLPKFSIQRTRTVVAWVVVLVLGVALSVEYATTINRPAFSMNSIPKGYAWLREQKNINVIAELPILDRPFAVAYRYVTAQTVHGKKLVNSHLPSQPAGSRNALGFKDNPDAIDFAIQRGAQAIVAYSSDCRDESWGKIAYEGPGWQERDTGRYEARRMCIYTQLKLIADDPMFAHITNSAGREDPMVYREDYYNRFEKEVRLRVVDSRDRRISATKPAFLKTMLIETPQVTPYEGDVIWHLIQEGRIIGQGLVSNVQQLNPIAAQINPSKDIILKVSDSKGNSLPPYQLSITSVTISSQ